MRDKPTWTLFNGVLFAGAVLFLLAFFYNTPFFPLAQPRTGVVAGGEGAAPHQSPAMLASPTVLPTRPPATPSPTLPPTSPPPTPTAVPLPVAGLVHELSAGNGTIFDVVQEREQIGRVAGWPPTPTPVPTPPSEPPTRIVAASIGLDAPVAPMYWREVTRGDNVTFQWVVPRNQAGWHFSSALPGQPGNTVISGHRNIYTEVFRYLDALRLGDEIVLVAGAERYLYRVTEMHVVQEIGVSESVRAQNARWIAPSSDVRLTLITCWPYEKPGNTHRLIVVARP
jgi:LPXTG-site transpeptidase (sortase) family protein